MRKITVNNSLTLDGVMQAPGRPDEDRRGGFERGQTHALELVESRSIPSGVMLQTLRPAGRATFGNAG
jgi:hypothetical protein